jgi:integrase
MPVRTLKNRNPSIANEPSYRRHKASGQAIVTLSYHDVYLGPYGSPESHDRYRAAVNDWIARGRRPPLPADRPVTVAEVVRRYEAFAAGYYGKAAKELGHVSQIVRRIRETFGETPARDFGPLRLKAVRERFITDGWCRKYVNANVQRVVRIFRWAAENELLPAAVFQALATVEGLRFGRTAARESARVGVVAAAWIEAVLPHVLPDVAAMIRLQALTGMRSGEVCSMRTADVDTSGPIWCYRPQRHKTMHHGHSREVWIGPRAQEILRPWLHINLTEYLFSPRHACTEQFAACPTHRRQPTQRPRSKRRLGERYSVTGYYQAVTAACDAADAEARGFRPPFACPHCGKAWASWHGLQVHARKVHGVAVPRPELPGERIVPRWHPHQLRHNAATEIRKTFNLEAAKCVLGQTTLSATQIYAEVDQNVARDVARQIG